MKFIKYVLAFAAAVVVASYLSSVSMCLVVFSASSVATNAHDMGDALTKVFYSVPLNGGMIAAPIVAMLVALIALALFATERYQLFKSIRQRIMATGVVAMIPGIGFGKIAGASSCNISYLGHAAAASGDCSASTLTGIAAFAITGLIAGLLLAYLSN